MTREPRASADERWRAKKVHYQDPTVVARYDAQRFRTRHQRGSTERKWRAITTAMGVELDGVRRVLDVPCGTGRFTERWIGAGKELVHADLSQPMLATAEEVAREAVARAREARGAAHGEGRGEARARSSAEPGRLLGGVRCDAERLPFADGAFDLVLSIRFLFHAPSPVRVAILREYARVSRRWVVIDVRHGASFTHVLRRAWAALSGKTPSRSRPSPAALAAEIAGAGLKLRRRVFLGVPFSEKMIAVCETGRAS